MPEQTSLTSYTVRETLDNTRAYDCHFCPESSSTLDTARRHHAAHVAGPALLRALQAVRLWLESLSGGCRDIQKIVIEAVAEANPKKEIPRA